MSDTDPRLDGLREYLHAHDPSKRGPTFHHSDTLPVDTRGRRRDSAASRRRRPRRVAARTGRSRHRRLADTFATLSRLRERDLVTVDGQVIIGCVGLSTDPLVRCDYCQLLVQSDICLICKITTKEREVTTREIEPAEVKEETETLEIHYCDMCAKELGPEDGLRFFPAKRTARDNETVRIDEKTPIDLCDSHVDSDWAYAVADVTHDLKAPVQEGDAQEGDAQEDAGLGNRLILLCFLYSSAISFGFFNMTGVSS